MTDIKIIKTAAEFAALEEPWKALAAQPAVRPFQEFGWNAAWASTLGTTSGRQLHVATLWQSSKLLAVLPMTVRRFNGVRILEWLGAKASDYCDGLVDAGIDGDAALSTLWDGVARLGGFDVARFGQVRTDAHVYNVLNPMSPWIETREESCGIDIGWPDGETWLNQLEKKNREATRYGMRRMAKLGFETYIWQPGEPYEPVLEAVIAQKRAWLLERNFSGFLVEPQGVEFLHAAVRELAAAGSLHLSAVRSSDRIAACHLGFMREGILYYYMPTYDPEYAKYSFGNLLRDALIMWACDRGLRRFDMLLGVHDYKTRYQVTSEDVRTLVVPRGMLGRAAVSFYRFSSRKRAAH
jgi:CelD/BcsL family acetyltransferase involved in cellulose biosynthesis